MASSARPRFLATGLAEELRRQRTRPLFLTRTCGSWTANTLEEMGTTIKAHLRSFESTSTHEPPAKSRRLSNTRTRRLAQNKTDRGQRRRRNTKTQATGQWKHIRLRRRQPFRNFAGARSLRRVPPRHRSRLARPRQTPLPAKLESLEPQTPR